MHDSNEFCDYSSNWKSLVSVPRVCSGRRCQCRGRWSWSVLCEEMLNPGSLFAPLPNTHTHKGLIVYIIHNHMHCSYQVKSFWWVMWLSAVIYKRSLTRDRFLKEEMSQCLLYVTFLDTGFYSFARLCLITSLKCYISALQCRLCFIHVEYPRSAGPQRQRRML